MKTTTTNYSAVCALFGLLASQASSKVVPAYPDGVPGSGYGCSNQCNSGDVNYVIRASLETYMVPGTRDTPLGVNGEDIGMLTRTFTGVANESSPFCRDYDGTSGPLGPCLTANPGQKINIKVINDIQNGMGVFGQVPKSLEEYWETGSHGWGQHPDTPEGMTAYTQDMPGNETSFDVTNIHLHGMQVVPHLFYPQGTGNATAEWITITPAAENPDQQCFCYVFEVPDNHPQGTFFWHIHRHGSTAMQAWQGMVGLLQIGNSTTEGSPDYELAQQGVTRDEALALWEWKVKKNNTINYNGLSNNTVYYEGQWDDQFTEATTWLTNNEYQPTFHATVNETIHFRLLCAHTTTGAALYVMDENNNTVPFHVFASDGISYNQTYEKNMVVVGPGQRESLLMQFNQTGTYKVVRTILIEDAGKFEDGGVAAYIQVTAPPAAVEPVDISQLTFTRGITDDIQTEEITEQVTVNFQEQVMGNVAPVPQFTIDSKLYDVHRIDNTVEAGTAQQWTLTSENGLYHPFHIHVNPFQVQFIYSGNDLGTLPAGSILDAIQGSGLEPANLWRDTIYIPPYGMVSLYQRFANNFQGKTVFHCHFLTHEDMGMIHNFMIADPSIVTDEDEEGTTDAPTTPPSGQRKLLRGRT